MPDRSLVIASFKYGLDTRRESLASLPGTLQVCNNAFVNSGGELEKRRAFVDLGLIPGVSMGLQDTDTGIMVFSVNASPGGLPTNVVWQQISYPTNAPPGGLGNIYFSCAFNGKSFALVNFDNEDATFAYYNGVLVAQISDGVVLTHPGGGGTPETISDLSSDLAVIVNRITGWLADANVTATPYDGVHNLGYQESALAGSTLLMSPIGVHFTPVIENNNSVLGLLGARLLDQNYPGIAPTAAVVAFRLNAGTNGTVNCSAPSHSDGSNVISITNGVVTFATTLGALATAIATAINNYAFVSGYTAIAVPTTATVIVYAPTAFGNFTSNLTVVTTGDITTVDGNPIPPTVGMKITLNPSSVNVTLVTNNTGAVTVFATVSAGVTGNGATPIFTWNCLNLNNSSAAVRFTTDGWKNIGADPNHAALRVGTVVGPNCTIAGEVPTGQVNSIQATMSVVVHDGVAPDVTLVFLATFTVQRP